MKYAYIVVICLVMCMIAWNLSSNLTAKSYEARIADLQELQNAETARLNTKIINGKLERDELATALSQIWDKYTQAEYNLSLMYQEDDEIIPADVYVDFVPDPLPEIKKVIEYVEREIEFIDYTEYSYRDANVGYSVAFDVKYEYPDGLFYFEPHSPLFVPKESIVVKPSKNRKTTISVLYFANKSGGMQVQYRIMPFLSIGGVAGWGENDPIVGVSLGYNF
jgi:hypothetical protein